MSKSSNFFEGFLIGTLVGSALGILFAPQAGTETRNQLKDIKEDNDDLIQDTKDKTEHLIEKTKESIEQGFDKLSSIIEEHKPFKKEEPSKPTKSKGK